MMTNKRYSLIFLNQISFFFVRVCLFQFTDGKAQLSLGVDEIYTLSTITTGNKGAHPNPPQSSPFPQVVSDMFEGNCEFRA